MPDLGEGVAEGEVVVAERANEIQVEREIAGGGGSAPVDDLNSEQVMPEVGPPRNLWPE